MWTCAIGHFLVIGANVSCVHCYFKGGPEARALQPLLPNSQIHSIFLSQLAMFRLRSTDFEGVSLHEQPTMHLGHQLDNIIPFPIGPLVNTGLLGYLMPRYMPSFHLLRCTRCEQLSTCTVACAGFVLAQIGRMTIFQYLELKIRYLCKSGSKLVEVSLS